VTGAIGKIYLAIMQAILDYAKRLKAISHVGLSYCTDDYDRERYEELESISLGLVELLTNEPVEKLSLFYSDTKEYVTPKTDIRAVVFNEKREILLVKERADGRWSLPGGWADIGISPKEVAVKEVLEETGLHVEPVRLLAVMDKRLHPHPPALEYVYKMFIQCWVTGGEWNKAFDILDKGFFAKDNLPPLSLERVLPEQVELMFEYLADPDRATYCD
jgi:ADP-ribose pyrophosphatase YjhB (NUDIX family)